MLKISGFDCQFFNNDIDGDGIPDDWDKYVGRTVADVAAEINGLGRYAKDKNQMQVFSSGSTVSLGSMALNKISIVSIACFMNIMTHKTSKEDFKDKKKIFNIEKMDNADNDDKD